VLHGFLVCPAKRGHCDAGHTVNFVLDESKALNGYAQNYFREIKASKYPNAERLGTIQPGDSRYCPDYRLPICSPTSHSDSPGRTRPAEGLEHDTP
jgi:hypothetical protein